VGKLDINLVPTDEYGSYDIPDDLFPEDPSEMIG